MKNSRAKSMRCFRVCVMVAIIACDFIALPRASAQRPSDAATLDPAAADTLYEKARAAFVEILVDGHMAGSGAFVDKDGYIVTASHVLAQPNRQFSVLSPEFGRLNAKLVAVDVGHDLALLKVDRGDKPYPALPIAASTPPVTTECFLIGTPLYRHALLLAGKVARATSGFEFMPNSKTYAEVFYIAGPSPPGTSGGAWINAHGELVGVQSMLMSVSNSAHGISFVAPPAAVSELLKNKRSASTPSLGMAVEEIWQHGGDVRKKYPQHALGLFVRSSRKDSPIRKAGLKEWELIQAVDGKPVVRMEDLISRVRAKKPGETIKLSVLEPGEKKPRFVMMPLAELEAAWKTKPSTAPK